MESDELAIKCLDETNARVFPLGAPVYQELPPNERCKLLLDGIATAQAMNEQSPHRDVTRKYLSEQEEEWHRFKALIARFLAS